MRYAVDLCCGKGGWSDGLAAAGWKVIGVDILLQPGYAHDFICADVRSFCTSVLPPIGLVCASPPCEDFSRHWMPWTRERNPAAPDLTIWQACVRIAWELQAPIVIENVIGAQSFMGKANTVRGSRFLWGDVPALLPTFTERKKESQSSSARMDRARIPFELAHFIGQAFLP